jgi:asparagine synthase (glutamine-hydrolysing)
MCGLAGYYHPNTQLTAEENRCLIERMCNVIAHRGPDDQGYFVSHAGVTLGHRRLSIIDLSAGKQPISNEDGSIWIVFNGEIYNYRELRLRLIQQGHQFSTNTDTEVIVHLYEEEGENCVKFLRGIFAFAIYDKNTRQLFLARDHVGVKPLHYAVAGEEFIFGSEIKSLLQHPAIQREVNVEAVSDFLAFGYVPEPKTAFRNLYKLPPGHSLTFKEGVLQLQKYWDFSYQEKPLAKNEAEYIEELRAHLSDAVRSQLVSDVPLGAFLSGGVDSSTIVALMTREINQPVKTFSIGFSEADFDELKFARSTAKHFGTDHHEFVVTPDVCKIVEEIVWHHDEPFADVSSVPTYMVSKLASEHVKVVLSGDGGDELFAGYERYAQDRRKTQFDKIPPFIKTKLLHPLSHALPRGLYGKNFLRNISLTPAARYVDSISFFHPELQSEMLTRQTRRSLAQHQTALNYAQIYASPTSADHVERLLYLDSKTYLPGDILTKVDRMSMAHSLESRVPLLDHKLIEFASQIPSSLKLKGLTTKYIFKKAVTDLIPEEIIHRRKQGFDVPIREWFKHDLREMLHDTLLDHRTRDRGFFNQHAIASLIKEHERGRRNYARHLWGLLTLELWHRAFIDRQPQASFVGAKHSPMVRLASAGAFG